MISNALTELIFNKGHEMIAVHDWIARISVPNNENFGKYLSIWFLRLGSFSIYEITFPLIP